LPALAETIRGPTARAGWYDPSMALLARMISIGIGRATAALANVGCLAGAFVCSEDEACANAGAGAVCQSDGWCSVSDEACESGQRYAEHSGDGHAGECVPGPGTTGMSASEATTNSDASATIDASGSAATSTSDATDSGPVTASTSAGPTTNPTDTDGETGPTTPSTSVTDTDPTAGSMCGDGQVEGVEECDDANVESGDGCTPECNLPECGDGYFDPGFEECEPGAGMVNSCAGYGLSGGDAECNQECLQSVAGCGPCEICGVQSACLVDMQCGGEDLCIFARGGGINGTCLEPCADDPDCPPGLVCTGAGFCGQSCDDDADCLNNRKCRSLVGAQICMW
jgi:cysteine-rich repeat protein